MKNKKVVKDIFEAKRQRRRDLSNLPLEEKIKILIHLQEIAIPIFAMRGIKKTAWKI